MRRRNFIQQVAALTGGSLLWTRCQPAAQTPIPGRIVGAAAQTGHLLRDKKFSGSPQSTISTDIVIVGAGISGLSAARHLHRNGKQDFLLLDLEDHTGGNASFGENKVSRYPWGAHYVPIPNNDLKVYLDFLEECDVITGYDEKGLPVYNEYYLCFDPEERLYLNGAWQDGLVPRNGLPEADWQQILKFLSHMQQLRTVKGKDGKDAFAIPVDWSSTDEQYLRWDQLTMKEWLLQQGYTSEYLHWYCNYCCRDDFGTRYDETSAWAGIHYFAARKGLGANAGHQDVLTWPEGNGWLVSQLQQDFRQNIKLNSLVISVRQTERGVAVQYLDVTTGKLQGIEAKQCILAVPQFIAQRLLTPDAARMKLVQQSFSYAPWMVANITVGKLNERRGEPLSWDNVIYNSDSLGYVNANHQSVKMTEPAKVLTYYLPLTHQDVVAERRLAAARSHEDWVSQIIKDLEKVHEGIAAAITNIDIMIWGHGMIRPVKGFIHGEARRLLQKPIGQSIFFAHTDLAGISIFEEGFYQGLQAAEALIHSSNKS